MLKQILFIVSACFACFTFFFVLRYTPYFMTQSAEKYQGIFSLSNDLNATSIQTLKLQHLQNLINFPILGTFFQDKKIDLLVSMQKYQESIKQANLALENSINVRSFKIWYNKALAECFVNKLQDCEMSLRKASLYAKKSQSYRVEMVYSILESKREKIINAKYAEELFNKQGIIDDGLANIDFIVERNEKRIEQF